MSGKLRLTVLFLLAMAISIGLPSPVEAQLLDKAKEAAAKQAEKEVVEKLARPTATCVFDDLECIEDARESGQDIQLTDENGEPVVDAEGNPVSDPARAAEILGKASPGIAVPGVLPGEGAITNLEFVPGESTILSVDFSDDNLGDFPRNFELLNGNFDVIEWQGDRYLRALSAGGFAIPLPETLPEKFTIETAVSMQHGNSHFTISPGRAYQVTPRDYRGSVVSVRLGEAGIRPRGDGPRAMTGHDRSLVQTQVAPLQVMADGEHMKVYLGDRRVANVPNAVFARSDTLFVAVRGSVSESHPILMGPIRVAASEVDLYDRLASEGRVTTHGILFDVNSDAIREESAPTLEEIGTMLQDHPELRISIEGHTDADGEEAFNQELSERRAASVKRHLVETYGIDSSRLETAGFGESVPVAPNDTPEGKQQNRRVELVKL